MSQQVEASNPQLAIRTRPNPVCAVCGREGKSLYKELHDRMGNAHGSWDFKQCVNVDCGMIWLDPQPIEDDIIKAYETYYTHHAGEIIWRLNPARSLYIKLKYGYQIDKLTFLQTIQATVKLLNVTRHAWYEHSVLHLLALPQGKLLEIGFGNGDALVELKRLGWNVEGVDFDLAAVELVRQRGIKAAHGSLQDQHYPDDHFDAIVMSHVIEHVYNPEWVIQECFRILKPQGKLVLLTPNNRSLLLQSFKDASFALDPPRHLNIFNVSSLKQLVAQTNFTTVKTFTTARNARSSFLHSLAIQQTGHYQLKNRHTLRSRLAAIAFHLKEMLHLRFDNAVGEELIVIGTK